MSNYIHNVPPTYQHAGAATQNPQSGQYNYQQPPPGSIPGAPPGGVTPGTAAGIPPNIAGSNQYPYQGPPPVPPQIPPPPAAFNSPSPPQGQWGKPPSSQSWKPSGPPSSAPPAPAATYNPGAYGPMPGAKPTPNSPTRYNPGSSGLGPGAPNTGAGYNQNVHNSQGQGYGYGSVPQQPATAPPQQQYQHQPPSGQQWSQQQGSSSGQNTLHQQQRPPPPLPPRPASVIYAPQDQLHSSPIQTNAQLSQQSQTPQQHQSPNTAPGPISQNVQSQNQQPDYYGQYQNQIQAPAPPPPKPQGYQQDERQNQQAQVLYSNQQTQGYNSQLQGQPNQQQQQQQQQPSTGYQYNQSQGQAQFQQQPSQYGQYDASAPPLPSKTADGSYFPPGTQQPQQGQNNGRQYLANAANPTTGVGASPDGWVTSPSESQPVYIPPSLSGQGVSAYQPSNANPQPGVYVPPPPENVPAWSQQQHAPLAPPPGAKRFKYTPPVLHPDYQPGGSKYNPQQAIQPTQPYLPDQRQQQQPQPQEWTAQPIEAQYPGQPGVEGWNQQVGCWQSVSHGDVPVVAPGLPPESQVPWAQQQEPLQGQNYQSQQTQQQQQQGWGEHQAQYPPQNHDQQYHHTQQPPEQQQSAQAVPTSIHAQNQQPQHQLHMNVSQANEDSHVHDGRRPLVMTPPVQTAVSPPSQNPKVGQTSSEEKDAGKQLVSSSALSASALGFGGPGDWEHFGLSAEDESVDDTALTAKKDDPVSPPQNAMVELPTDSSPTLSSKEQPKITHQDPRQPEVWPTPPAPAPLTLNRPVSTLTGAVQDGGRYAPTPPPNNRSTYPHLERAASIVSVEDHDQGDSIDSTMQAWARQQSQLTLQQRHEAGGQHTSQPPKASQSFVMDDGGWSNPIQHKQSTVGDPGGNRSQSQTPTQTRPAQQQRPQEGNKPNILAPTSQSFVVDDGFSGQPQQRESSASASISQPSQLPSETQSKEKASVSLPAASQSFVMDDGSWSSSTQVHDPIVNVQTAEEPRTPVQTKPVPISSQSFVMDDGGWSSSTQVHEPIVGVQTAEEPRTPVQTKPVPTSSQSFVVDGGGAWSVQNQLPNSSAEAPSPQQPLAQRTIQPAPASYTSFVVDDGVLHSETPQHGGPASSNAAQTQLDFKKQMGPEPVALYSNLDPWYKASLERYAAMVNAESLAATDEERTKLFTDFMIEESRLRGVRYGVGIGPRADGKRNRSGSRPSVNQTRSTSPQRGRQMPKPVSTDVPSTVDDIEYSPGGRPRLRSQSARGAKARNGVGVSNPHGESATRSSQSTATPPPQNFAVAAPPKQTDPPLSPGRNAPIPIESSVSGPSRTAVHPPSPTKPRNKSRPITPGSTKSSGPAPEKPAYIPFRPPVAEGPKISESPYKPYMPPSSLTTVAENYKSIPATTNTKPAYVPFMPSVPADTSSSISYNNVSGLPLPRKTSLDSASQNSRAATTNEHVENFLREDGNGKVATYGRDTPRRRDTTDIVPVREKFSAVKVGHSEAILPSPMERVDPFAGKRESSIPQQGRDLMAGLERILPSDRGLKADGSMYIAPIRKCMDALPDNLNFSSDAIAAWEVEAKKIRETHDRERRIRQEEQEEHTDQLFSEKQIGYGDISALEEDFKLSEREKKSKEDKEEYESFVTEVFSRGYDHFQEEIKQLMDQYVSCTDLMTSAIAGKEALQAHNDKPDLSQIMSVFVALHKKIELRHEAVFQVIMERDKRFKKTVIQPLYAAGNIPEVKKMEKHFDEADKKSALEAAKKRDQRAKRLMRSVEENTMNTLREDLNYMDEITQEVHNIFQALSPSASGNYSGIAQALSGELVFAQTILKTLAGKSEALMQSFHTAALEINTAEYDVSHASARLNNESSDTINRLREDMLKENERLSKELEHRISVVRGDFQKANDEILTLLPRLEKLKVPPAAEQGSPKGVDPEYDIRMKKALEAAKKRNAGKGGSPENFA